MTEPIQPQLTSTQPADADAQQQTTKKTDLEARIDRLVGVTKQATQDVERQRADNSELRSLVASLASQVEKLTSTKSPAPAGNPPSATLDSGTPVEKQTGPGATLSRQDVQDILTEVLTQRDTAAAENNRLFQAQQECYRDCIAEMPTLDDPRTPEGQAFIKLYNGRPDLQRLPDGPRIAMSLVRDVITQSSAAGRVLADRKDRARALQPGDAGRDLDAAGVKELADRHKTLVETGNRRPWTDQEFDDYLSTKLALTASQGRGPNS